MTERPRSQRDAQGRFVNPWPIEGGATRGFRDIMRWQRQRMRDGRPAHPPAAAFETATPVIASPHAPDGELRITWVGHSTFLLQLGGINVLTDPVWSRRVSPISWIGPSRLVPAAVPFDSLPPIHAVLISHDHYDHLDEPTVRRLHRRFGAQLQWIAPLGHGEWLERRGITNVTELDWWQHAALQTERGVLHVYATPAQHWTKRSPFSERTRLWSSFVLQGAGANVFYCGDSGYFEQVRTIGEAFAPFDAVLMPIGAYEPRWFMKAAHMNAEEAVQSYADLGAAGTFVAMHWCTFRLTDEDAFEPPQRTRAAWHERNLPPDDLFIARHGETRILTLG